MKMIKAVVQPHKLKDVKDSLAKAGVTKMTVSTAVGCGQQKGFSETYRGVITEVNLLNKTIIEIAVNEDYVDATVQAIIDGARTGNIGDGKIFISELKEAIRIRTGEKGKDAIG
ncbi:MAG: transcriptional regulator [Spirochaetaceae bacterium]|nr:transcriptional regulator [Spirochaetaceae bacterium]|tara:strand:- start:11913 stop:12254 length:342 start_codon:yes stop_codon:yes gene_type:complete